MDTDFDPLDDIFGDGLVKNAKVVGKFQPKAKFRPTKKGSAATSVATPQAVPNTDSTQADITEPVGNAKLIEPCSDDVPNDDGCWHDFMEKSVEENCDVFIGLETLGDFLPHTSSECTAPPSNAIALNVPNPEDSTHACKVADISTYPGLSEDVDCLTAGEPVVTSSDGRDQMHDRELEREEMDAMDSVNMTELTSGSEKNSVPTFQQDDVLDLSSFDFSHTSPCEPTSELPLAEESRNFMEMAKLDSGIRLQGVPEIPAKLVSRRAKTGSSNTHIASDPSSQQQEASSSSQENETGRSLRSRKRKTNFCELVDEGEEVLTNLEFSEECPLSIAMEEENINEELGLENESQAKKSKRKSEKPDDDKEKPSRKRKKAKEASDQDAGAKPKKFCHSTRRRRVVDKVLLETPEDEIDYNNMPLRDLIARAEYQEKQMKKDDVAVGAPLTNQSIGNSSGLYNEDQTFISKQGVENNDEQGNSVGEDTTAFFNYQTYMDKTPSTRWSKQDTELFYEAVREFGTDLSMIQQLFPSRTRRQVKLKYKKEERQHPMRLRDALTSRTTDHSHFKKVIEYLKQIAAEEKQNTDGDDAIDLTGNDVADEGASNPDDKEPNDEHIQEGENNDEANDLVEVQSPLRSDDGEDDMFMWSQYKSDT